MFESVFIGVHLWSELHLHSYTDLTGAEGAFGAEEGVVVEVDELGAEAEDGLVQDVVEFDRWAKANAIAKLEFASHIEVEDEETRTDAGVPRQVSGLTDGWDSE
jgi:hypothetical protein